MRGPGCHSPKQIFVVTARRLWMVALCLSVPIWAGAMDSRVPLHEDEIALLQAVTAIEKDELDGGLQQLEGLLRRNPQFHSARLLYGDLLMAKAGKFGVAPDGRGKAAARLEALRAELYARVRNGRNGVRYGAVPAPLLQLSQSQRRAVVVDISRARLYVVERSAEGLRVLSDNYVSTGKQGPMKLREGDQRTPLGVYFITTRLNPRTLSDFYGAGALPINYPNEWDLRHGRTGHGIWVHGVPTDTYARAPRASDGCVVLPNANMRELLRLSDVVRTPVVIADQLDWVDGQELSRRREEFLEQFDTWRKDWESLDFERYARHYAQDFAGDVHTLESWLKHKRRVNRVKKFIFVEIKDLSVLAYPGETDMVVASFEQNYRSSNYAGVSRKRQYWRRNDSGNWRVIYEGAARFRPVHRRGIPFSSRSGYALNLN